ncbi:peptidoglycan DD-metalloendopeptidase family protein [Bartonella sp. CB189]|uniref:peptidoglycan DD-metalloendopeptidase family protein n=1 Tax=Bartonella sp. CB189 TaxID=3112254 RepID=UPI002F9638A9
MYLKVLGNIFKYNFLGIILGTLMFVLVGCSSGTQRFSNIFSNSQISAQSNSSITPSNMQTLSYNDVIQTAELPPVELRHNQQYNNVPYDSSRQDRISSPDGRVMGDPPRNLGTLSRSQMRDSSVVRQGSYIVQSGDTLVSIARQIGVSVDAIKLANGIRGSFIHVGQVLIVPDKNVGNTQNNSFFASTTESPFPSQAAFSMKHRKDSSVYKVPETVVPSAKINKLNIEKSSSRGTVNHEVHSSSRMTNADNNVLTPQATGISKMRWPVRGRLLSRFGQKKGTATNRGVDIAVPEGSSVKAAENGVVIYASDGLKELGNVVMIRHENDVVTIYGHNSRLVVDRGQRIRRGDEIAKSGISGVVKTPRVYFEVRKNSRPVDPIEYLEK